jgi:hypothetical protein
MLADIYILANPRSAALVHHFLDRFLPDRVPAVERYEVPQYADRPEMVLANAADSPQVASGMSAGPGRGPTKAPGSGIMAQGDLRSQAPRDHRFAVSAVALVLGVPQLGHQLPGPGRHGSSSEHEGSPQGPQLDTLPFIRGTGTEPRRLTAQSFQKRRSSKAIFLSSR